MVLFIFEVRFNILKCVFQLCVTRYHKVNIDFLVKQNTPSIKKGEKMAFPFKMPDTYFTFVFNLTNLYIIT